MRCGISASWRSRAAPGDRVVERLGAFRGAPPHEGAQVLSEAGVEARPHEPREDDFSFFQRVSEKTAGEPRGNESG